MKYFASGYDLTNEMSIPAATLEKTFKQKEPFGKKFFQNGESRMDD